MEQLSTTTETKMERIKKEANKLSELIDVKLNKYLDLIYETSITKLCFYIFVSCFFILSSICLITDIILHI